MLSYQQEANAELITASFIKFNQCIGDYIGDYSLFLNKFQ